MGDGWRTRPLAGTRRAAGLLCVAILHFGVWYLAGSTAPAHDRHAPAASTSANVISLRLIRAPIRRANATASIAAAPVVRLRRWTEPPPPVPQHDDVPVPAAITPLPATPDETAVPASTAALPDSATVKHVIAVFVAHERENGTPSVSAFTSHRSAAANAIGAAFRPRCNSDDAAKLGSVHVTGLLKLPALVGGALSDKGCKW
jgi:hypothetical protein